MTFDSLSKVQKKLLSGASDFALHQDDQQGRRGAARAPSGSGRSGDSRASGWGACANTLGSNVKVNAYCLNLTDPDLQGRAQANNETSIAQDPANPDVLLASANDYRRGDGGCYTSYSSNGGRSWQDSTPPTGFTRGRVPGVVDFGASRQYWDAGGDTSVSFDTRGNGYLSCQLFKRGKPTTNNPDISSALVVLRATQNGGASWNFPARYVRASADVTASGVPPFLDKQLMTVDAHTASPFRDRVYVTWTEFAADGSAFIYAASSADYAEHFSAPHLVSSDSALCTQTFGAGTTATTGQVSHCNENQFSQPFTGPDGALYVAWANFNNTASAGLRGDGSSDAGGTPSANVSAPVVPADNRN